MKKYNGLDVQKELISHSDEDYVAGSTSLRPLIIVPMSEREKYLPDGEVQKGLEDTQDCASRAPHNILETAFLYGLNNDKFSAENTKWLHEKGYAFFKDGILKFEVSDAFTAILSGTTPQGNSLKAPLHSIHKNGLIPKKMLPLHPHMKFVEYMNFKRITREMKDLGLEFISRFFINYEKMPVDELEKRVEEDFVIVGGHAWPMPENGEYPSTGWPINHAFIIYSLPSYNIFDNYEEYTGDFIKKLAADYKFLPYAYRIYISHEAAVDRTKKKKWWEILLNIFILKHAFQS